MGVAANLPLSSSTAGVREARRLVESVVARTPFEADAETVCLLTSELVANAIEHGAPPVSLIIDLTEDTARVEVLDRETIPPRVVATDPWSERGRGMRLVAALADAWGSEPVVAGKRVWFELRRHSG